jgi:hypothetical protein
MPSPLSANQLPRPGWHSSRYFAVDTGGLPWLCAHFKQTIGLLELAKPHRLAAWKAMEYSCRYFAFVDILGFSNLIRQSQKNTVGVGDIHQLLKMVHKPVGPRYRGKTALSGLRAQSISDAVAISTKTTEEGLEHILAALRNLSFRLLRMGYFVRGGLVRGQLVHEENTVFGPALIDAYHLESAVAKFPRIMISRDVMNDIRTSSTTEQLPRLVIQSVDGPFSVNVLAEAHEDTPDEYQSFLLPQMQNIAIQIGARLDEATDNPSHYEKVHWFARTWNESIPNWASECEVKGPGLARPPTAADMKLTQVV